MTGAADIDIACRRREADELPRRFLVDQFGLHATHQKDGQMQARQTCQKLAHRLLGIGIDIVRAVDEFRIPVPTVAPVASEPQILAQSFERARALAMRKIAGDGVGRLFKRRETVLHPLAHETLDPCDAVLIHTRRDVDENQ